MAAIIHLLWLVLMLSWSLEDVKSQRFPYVSFHGQTLANHSYVDLSPVGDDYYSGSDSVQCHTDLSTCCTGTQGVHRGDWYSLVELLDCHSLVEVISMSIAELRELLYIAETMLSHQLVSIAVIFQLMLSMLMITTH